MQNTTLKGHSVQNILTDVKTAGAVSVATIGSAILDFMQPIAGILGVILTTILIYNHFKKGRLERRALKLEIERGEQALKRDRRQYRPCD